MARRRSLSRLAAALLAACGGPALSATIVTSSAPDSVAVTIYRDPDRRTDSNEPLDLDWLDGYALITEKRTVQIPAGNATIRFEGVAGGLLPESALITGLPTGVREKNLDAALLSPGSLYARSFGRPVTLRRQHKKTGKIIEERAIIRSGPDGSVLLQTREGFEAANCSPLNDSLIYPGVPPGLSAKPTLSVETNAPGASKVTLSLSYLAWGFDWQANYILRLRERRTQGDLSAWVTLASSDPTSFVNAEAMVVGGKVNAEVDGTSTSADKLVYHCLFRPLPPPPPPAPPSMNVPMTIEATTGEIIVTAHRATSSWAEDVTMTGEGLGDLKLYRMPIPTTIASNSQKQVALFTSRPITFSLIYFSGVSFDFASQPEMLLRTKNEAKQGLGIALPTGPLAMFEPFHGEPMMVAMRTGINDKPVGEELEIIGPRSHQVTVESVVDGAIVTKSHPPDDDDWENEKKRRHVTLTVRNANPWPIDFEASLYFGRPDDDAEDWRVEFSGASAKLGSRFGRPLWRVRVPANGSAQLEYTLRKKEIEKKDD